MNARDSDIIGTAPRPDLGPLFVPPSARDKVPSRPGAVPDARRSEEAEQDRRSTFPFALPDAADRAAKREIIKRTVLPDVLELAAHSAHLTPKGFTPDDVRDLAIEKQLITGEEQDQRALSWIGPWLFALARRGTIAFARDDDGRPLERPSERPKAHGNPQYVYTAAT
jgi:hypothetical protein